MTLPASLSTAVAEVYRAFAHDSVPLLLEASPLKDAAKIEVLTESPLRAITTEAIGYYNASAITTIGTEADYRYFLPRILEGSLDDRVSLAPQDVAVTLNRSHWRDWPPPEKAAILSFFHAAFAWSLDTHPDHQGEAANWLFALAILRESLERSLALWRATSSANAALQLAAMIGWGDAACASDSLAPEDINLVRRWLASEATQAQLIEAVDRIADRDLVKIDAAFLQLEAYFG